MLDLETMGTATDSAIIAIGAVKFDSEKTTEEFYINISLESCVNHGLKIDANTIMWWLSQSKEAQEVFEKDNVELSKALMDFNFFVDKDTQVWGNSAAFDNSILINAYKAIGKNPPWKFWDDMCYRTVKNLNKNIKLEREGTHHNALDDAKSQALHLIEIFKQSN